MRHLAIINAHRAREIEEIPRADVRHITTGRRGGLRELQTEFG